MSQDVLDRFVSLYRRKGLFVVYSLYLCEAFHDKSSLEVAISFCHICPPALDWFSVMA